MLIINIYRVCACVQLVRKCNEGARTMERTEMMYTINSQLEFKIKVRKDVFMQKILSLRKVRIVNSFILDQIPV